MKQSRPQTRRLPDPVRLALRRYFPSEVSAQTAAYYTLPEHLALLRLRSEAESRMLRWNDVASEIAKELADLDIRVTPCTAFSNSYMLEILLHENIRFPERDEELFGLIKTAPIRILKVAASFLIPYWTASFRNLRRRGGRIVVKQVPQQGRHSTRAVHAAGRVLKAHGWTRIPSSMAQTKIPNMDMQNIESGEVRIADVVFGEQATRL
ncbi:MAG: hypothetical protein ACE5ID_11730 [Acidobacteriota bacterium]